MDGWGSRVDCGRVGWRRLGRRGMRASRRCWRSWGLILGISRARYAYTFLVFFFVSGSFSILSMRFRRVQEGEMNGDHADALDAALEGKEPLPPHGQNFPLNYSPTAPLKNPS